MSEVIYTVSQINKYISNIFDNESLLKGISISGEVTNASMSGGYIYFNIKDDSSMLACVCFDKSLNEFIKNGSQVLVTGSISYYSKGGKLTFIVKAITPYGEGLLYKKFLELKDKLAKEGLFDAKYKKTIPKYIKRIGVVSSNTGAVIRDIINITKRRNDTIDIVLYPVKVQGVGAEEQISRAIDFFSTYDNVDIVIVARGGGSFEDLMPFNTEIVARSTFNCKKPIISAVGHETDYTIIDFVSDLRAPTPSAAAELCVYDKFEEINKNKNILLYMYSLVKNSIETKSQNVAKLVYRTQNNIENKFLYYNEYYKNLLKNIYNFIAKTYEVLQTQTNANIKLLNNFNPENVVKRGYAKILLNDKIAMSVNDINIKDKIKIELKDGILMSEVTDKYDI